MTGLVQLTLERDGHDQPWGFRLQGGSDVGLPLSVQRVLVGTPAEGILRKNDVIIRISQTDAKGLTHQQAADIFNRAGNQIAVTIKRAGVQTSPAAATAHTGAIVANGPHAGQQSPPVSGGVALPGFSVVTSSPKVSEPYRTVPLIQPSVKPHPDLGVGSLQHLKMQEDHITGVKEPQLVPVPQAQVKASEILMKQKVTGTLQQIHNQQNMNSGHSSPVGMGSPKPGPTIDPILAVPLDNADILPPGVVNKQFNSPINLYSGENVQEAVRQQVTHTSLVNPVNKPPKHQFPRGLPRMYDPEQSATWQAIHEMENCQLVTEHGPTESKVYSI